MAGERIITVDIGEPVQYDPANAQTQADLSTTPDGLLRRVTRTKGGAGIGGYTRIGSSRAAGCLYARFRVAALASNGVMLGVVDATASQSTYIGGDGGGWSYWSAGQTIHPGGVLAQTALSVGDYVDLAWAAAAGKLWFGRNGVWVGSGDPATGANPTFTGVAGPLWLAVGHFGTGCESLLVPDDADCKATCPAGFTPWGLLARVASRGFATAPTDTPAHAYYDGRIAQDGDPIYARTVSCVVWDKGQRAGPPLGDIELINIDGALDYWLGYTLRGMPVRIRLGYDGQLLRDFVDVASATVLSREFLGEERVRLVLADPGERINKALQPTAYPASIPNSSLAALPQPITMGLCQWVPLAQTDAANLQYAFHDGPNGGLIEERDQGVVITPSTGWSFGTRTDTVGIKRLTNPSGKQCGRARGAVQLTTLLYDFDFTNAANWTADNPNGWVLGFVEDANNKVTFNGGAQMLCNGAGPTVIMERGAAAYGSNATIAAGSLYWVEVTLTVTGGQLEVQGGGASATDLGVTTLAVAKGSGTLRFGLACTATSVLRLAVNKAAGVNVTVQRFRLWSTSLIERLPQWLTELCVTRGGLTAADLDSAGSIAALDAAAPYRLGLFVDQSVKIPDVLKQTLDSFCGWWFWSRLGQLKVGALTDPALGVPLATFTDVELIGDIRVEDDLAPGLSDTVAAQRNWAQHAAADLAGSVLLTADAGLLQADYLIRKTGASALAAPYTTAKGAPAIPTLLTQAGDAQSLADSVTALYSTPRAFYSFTAAIDDDTTPRVNLALRSQQLAQSPWGVSNASVTDNAAVAPDGSTTAATIQDASNTQFGSVSQSITVPADTQTYAVSVYLKKTTGGTQPTFGLNLYITGGTTVANLVRINADLGTVLAGTATVLDAGGWWRIVAPITNNGTANNTTLLVGLFPATAAYGVATDAVAAMGTATVWGVQVQVGPRATQYVPTTTAPAQQVTSYTLEPGMVVRIKTDQTKRFGLSSGKNVLVVSAKSRFLSNQVDIVAWG